MSNKPSFFDIHKDENYKNSLIDSLTGGITDECMEYFELTLNYVINEKCHLFKGHEFNGSLYEGFFIKHNYNTIYDSAIFENIYSFKRSYTGDKIEDIDFIYDVGLLFYTIVSKKKQIQDSMEQRALNKIIQKITGDDSFEW